LLITDVIMPEMSGPAMAEQLRAVWPSMRVLYMSGYTNDIILSHGAKDSGRDFLQKPFTMKSLTAKIRELLDTPAS
jgi:FixJ family two-component response regulator